MADKYELILSAEESLARQVALGVIVMQPLTVWHYLIPFMFIYDFLKRTVTIRRYTQHFMFPRRLAVDAARDILGGEAREERQVSLGDDTKGWLHSLDLYSDSLYEAQMKVIDLLVDHYAKLLQVEGDTYDALVRNAYTSGVDYEAHLTQLTSVEKEVDRAIMERLGETEKLREKILAEQEQLARMRQKDMERIF
ncbi:MAG: NF038143 family protein [Desulfobacteraceae bacterium]|jgi:hypothetical protein